MYRAKLIAFFIAAYAIGTFLYGLNFDLVINTLIPNSPQESASESPAIKTINAFLIGLLGWGIVPLFENWIADEATNKAKEEAKKEIEIFQENYKIIYQAKYAKDIEEILSLLQNQNINSNICKQITEQINEIGERVNVSLIQYEVAQKIVEWLSESSNRKNLRNRAVEYVIKNSNLKNQNFRNKFSYDILQCLNWLSDRLKEFAPRQWNEEDEEELTSAIKANLSNIEPYEKALDFIVGELKRKDLDETDTGVIEYYVNELKKQYQNWYNNLPLRGM